jgi:hypothetical protein
MRSPALPHSCRFLTFLAAIVAAAAIPAALAAPQENPFGDSDKYSVCSNAGRRTYVLAGSAEDLGSVTTAGSPSGPSLTLVAGFT